MTTSTAVDRTKNSIAWPALVWIGFLHVGALLAFVPAYFTWGALLTCVILHWVTGGLGITLTYHRLLTHRSFEVRPKWLEYLMVAIAASASEGGPIGWVADHRRHHAHSDEDGDVHSPAEGFGWAHMFWWMTPDITAEHTPDYFKRWTPDLLKDPVIVWMNRYFLLFPIGGAIALYAAGQYFAGAGMSYLAWGFFMRSVLVLHSTWLVNSATHVWGYRSHETRDNSTNLWWVALITYGEGWHNNHHAFQTSARHGMRWWEFDMTYWTIRVMQLLGLATKIKMPKLTHAAPIVSPQKAAKAARKARRRAARQNDAEPELAAAAASAAGGNWPGS